MKKELKITIPEDIVNALKLKKEDRFKIYTEDDKIVIKVNRLDKFYGILKVEGVKEWPKPEEIKAIWE